MPEEKKKGKNITNENSILAVAEKKVIDTTPSNAARKQEIIQVTRLPLSRYHYIEKNAFAKVFCTKLIPNSKQQKKHESEHKPGTRVATQCTS